MYKQIQQIRRTVIDYASGFDAQSILPSEAAAVVRTCAKIEASIASVKALAAARAAEGGDWKHDGSRSPSDHLARQTGSSQAQAKKVLETGKKMSSQPEVAKAALAGELSPEQTAAVTDGAAADPTKAAQLIEKAKTSSLAELNQEVALVKAQVTDLEQRRKEIHTKRYFRRWTDRDGAFQAHLYGHPEDGARLWRAIDPIRRRLIMLRRGKTPNQSLDALDYDALITFADIACGHQSELTLTDLIDLGLFPQITTNQPVPDPAIHATINPANQPVPDPPAHPTTTDPTSTTDPTADPTSTTDPITVDPDMAPARDTPSPRPSKKLAGSQTKVMIRVDLDTLLRGFPLEGELCELAGYGPIPVSVINDTLASGNAFVIGILTKAGQVQGVYHHRRRPNAQQKTALEFLYPTCAVKGCNTASGLQADHREDWSKTHYTIYDLLDHLCRHHHGLKTHSGWALVPGTGKRHFVAPDDPRHPRWQHHHPPSNSPTGPSP